jgi:hypothetical protein
MNASLIAPLLAFTVGYQVNTGPSDARWGKLPRHVGERVIVSTRTHSDIRGTLRAPDADAIELEQGLRTLRVARAEVCDIIKAESPVMRNARWGTIGAGVGLGAGFLFILAQGLSDVPDNQRTVTPGGAFATGATAGFTVGWLAARKRPAPTADNLYADYDRNGCR